MKTWIIRYRLNSGEIGLKEIKADTALMRQLINY